MLLESLEFLLTPTSPIARKYGFLYSSISLRHRYHRQKKNWLPHLKNCQDIFLETAQSLPQRKSVVVMGSAHLHEIPLHLLMDNFQQVTLVDVIHPLKHHLQAKRYSRLKLVTMDLTNALDKIQDLNSLDDLNSLAQKMANEQLFHFDADLIVSANLLSQLALLPLDAVEKKIKRPLELPEKDIICTQFAETHLKNLKSCTGTKLIYSDREVIYRDKNNEVIYTGQYPVNFEGYQKLKEWYWMLAPLKEASKDYSIEMKIEAYRG
ncbi:hypothetical protein [Bdellovibrio sp. GT3]|uniref:hypothetical protein n=1 Tax=Bdellovibrio sp. GT3 TaxID=3136282 RepID=UPI0030F2FE6C